MSSLSQEQRNNTGTHLSGDSSHPSSEDPEGLLDILDAIASICVVDREVYFVSLAMDPDATLYVSTNGKVPATVTAHLLGIRRGLTELKAVLEPGPSNNTNYPDPNVIQAQTDGELKLQQMMYQHSYPKLQRQFQKRWPTILRKYKVIESLLPTSNADDLQIIFVTYDLLSQIDILLKEEQPSTRSIQTIAMLSGTWRGHKRRVELLNAWEEIACMSGLASRIYDTHIDCRLDLDLSYCRKLSLERLLEKLFTLHCHIQSILRIVWSRRLSPVPCDLRSGSSWRYSP